MFDFVTAPQKSKEVSVDGWAYRKWLPSQQFCVGLFKLDHSPSLTLTKQFLLPKFDQTVSIKMATVREMGDREAKKVKMVNYKCNKI